MAKDEPTIHFRLMAFFFRFRDLITPWPQPGWLAKAVKSLRWISILLP